jgi:AraC-like DNA-binding protein
VAAGSSLRTPSRSEAVKKFFTCHDPVVSVHRPRVLVRTALAQGADRDELFENTGLAPSMLEVPETMLSYAQFGTLVRNALRLTRNAALGLDVGRNMRAPQLGMLGFAMISSPTVGAALDLGLRHSRTIAPSLTFELQIDGELARLSIRESIELGRLKMFVMEWALSFYESFFRALVTSTLPVRRLELSYPRPEHAERYLKAHDVPIEFDRECTCVVFDAALLDEEIAYSDQVAARMAEQSHALYSPTFSELRGVLDQTRGMLGAWNGSPPSLDALAQRLQTSARTLRRSLREMGTSYHELLNDARRTRAVEWVRDTDMTMIEIAARLGFSDVRSFRRAFKRWTGQVPTTLRTSRLLTS